MAETYLRLIAGMSLGVLILTGCASTPGGEPVEAREVSRTRDTAPEPEPPPSQINPASQALVTQSLAQSASGDYASAAASLERALRIDSRNPEIWLELSRLRLKQGNFAQAESLGKKAVSLAGSNHNLQVAAWRLVANALRGQGRIQEAREVEANVVP